MTPSDVDREPLVQRYEQLRENVLARPRQSGSALGEAIVVRHGLAAWIEQAGQPGTALPAALPQRGTDATLVLPTPVRSELLNVLTNLVLAHRLSPELSP